MHKSGYGQPKRTTSKSTKKAIKPPKPAGVKKGSVKAPKKK